MAVKMTAEEVAQAIRVFLAGSGRPYDWDDFLSVRIKDPRLDAIRRRCNSVRDEYPPYPPLERGYCNKWGRAVLAELAEEAERLASE